MLRLLSGALAGFFLSTAFAQDDAVVVTATRFPDSKRDLPVGVTVISADDIRSSASSNLGDVLAQFGLLQIRDLAGTQNPQIDLRGFGITGDQNSLILLDGVRISENEIEPAQLSGIPLEAIERIEIVRGSGAVQYGGGATGGTINIVTRRGRPGEKRASALARAGGYGTEEGRAAFARSGEALGGGLVGSYEDTEGYRRNSHYRQRNLAGRVDADLGAARAYARLALDEQRQRLPGSLSEAELADDPRQTHTPDDWREREGVHLALGGTTALGRHEASADFGYRTKHSRFAALATGSSFTGDTDVDEWTFAPRAKLGFNALGRSHDFIVGVDLQHWSYASHSQSVSLFGTFPSRLESEQSNAAIYGQLSAWIAERTRMVLGARHQHFAQRLATVEPAHQEDRDSRGLEAYEVALCQGFAGGWSAYAKYGKSFRVATFDENACFSPPCGTPLLEPQTAQGLELGVEYERRTLRARASVYQTNLQNEIYFSPLVGLFGSNVNLSPTRRRGAELEAAWRAASALELRGALALLQASFRSDGNAVPLVPGVLATAGMSWSYAPRSRLSVNARYVGRQRFDNDQANVFRKQPAYGLVDLKVEHALARAWQLALEVRNLFDKQYFSYGRLDDPRTPTTFSALPAPERAAYLSLAWTM
jgi:iron complex outermembrane receptor protein